MSAAITATIAICLATTIGPGVSTRQQTQFPRLAAVRFAIENGWKLPKTNIVVVVETHLGAIDGRPVPQSDAQRLEETELIAKLLGPGAKTGAAKDYLSCRGSICSTSTDAYVLVVNGLYQGETDVLINLHTPPSRTGLHDASDC